MSTALTAGIQITGDITMKYAQTDNAFRDVWKFGSGLMPAWTFTQSNGNTANTTGLAKYHYHKAHTLTTATSVTLDLTALAQDNLPTLTFAKVKWIFIRLRDPSNGIYVTVGNAAADVFTWLSATTTTDNVYDLLLRTSPINGWTVDATHKNLKIANPGLTTVIVDVSIDGY